MKKKIVMDRITEQQKIPQRLNGRKSPVILNDRTITTVYIAACLRGGVVEEKRHGFVKPHPRVK